MLLSALSVAAAIFFAELGDKTQLFIMGLAAKEKLRDIIIGTVAAILLLNAIGVYLGVMISGFVKIEMIQLAAGFLFLIFAYLTLSEDDDDVQVKKVSGIAALSIGAMFFIAELGDKTQLSAIAFAAENPEMKTWVFIGAVLGMFAADGVGLLAGIYLGKKLPRRMFSYLAVVIFTAFGLYSVWKSVSALAPQNALALTAAVAAAYILILISAMRCKAGECAYNTIKKRCSC